MLTRFNYWKFYLLAAFTGIPWGIKLRVLYRIIINQVYQKGNRKITINYYKYILSRLYRGAIYFQGKKISNFIYKYPNGIKYPFELNSTRTRATFSFLSIPNIYIKKIWPGRWPIQRGQAHKRNTRGEVKVEYRQRSLAITVIHDAGTDLFSKTGHVSLPGHSIG